jgi:hypothetical protein
MFERIPEPRPEPRGPLYPPECCICGEFATEWDSLGLVYYCREHAVSVAEARMARMNDDDKLEAMYFEPVEE